MSGPRTPPPGFEVLRTSAFLDRIGPLYVGPSAEVPTFGAFVAEHHLNTHGGAHGGFLAAIADVAAARGARMLLADGRAVRTVSTTMDYMSAASLGDWLDVSMTIDHAGRRTIFASCRITRDGDMLVARAVVVLTVSA